MKQNCCIPTSTMSPIREVNAERMNSYYMDKGLEPQGYVFELSDIDTTLLPETIEKGRSNYLKLPLYRQSHNFTCGVACVMSILRYAGYEFIQEKIGYFGNLVQLRRQVLIMKLSENI